MLEGLSFTFGAGRISVILGPGGSGKSTLLKALGGGEKRAEGPWVRGLLELPDAPPRSMPQTARPGGLILADLVGRREGGPSAEMIVREVWRAIPAAFQSLRPILELPLERLTYAQLRLAEFTAAVSTAPFILLDEPEAGLEPEVQGWMVQRLNDLRGARTVIVATHHLGVARAVADSAILLSEGTMVEAGGTPEFFDRPRHPRTRHFVEMGS